MKEALERLKIILKDIRINEHDIKICREYNDYEDMGFYTQLRSDLDKELKETLEKYIKEVEEGENSESN